MTIIDYFNQFWREFSNKRLSPNESLLYSYLLFVWNSTGRKERFECNTKEIEVILGMNKMTLTRCRENLRKRGLIQYNKGDRKIKSPYYFLCNVTNDVTNDVTNKKENISPTPPIKEKREREKENISKDIQKKEESGLSFCLPSFVPIMEEWLEYKREKKQKYTERGIRACYHNLVKLSNNSPEIAKLIVEQSIANNWSGLFELKTNGRTQENLRPPTRPSFSNYNEAEAKHVGSLDIIEL